MDLADPRILRHLAAAAFLGAMALGAWPLVRRLDAEPGRRAQWAGMLAVVALFFAMHHAFSPPWDDESRRLVAVQSLLSDGDLDLADEYGAETWRSFRNDGPAFFTSAATTIRNRLADHPAPFYPRYAVGYTVLLAPLYGAGALLHPGLGRLLATLPGIACSAVSFLLLVAALVDRGLDERRARRVAAAFALSAPWLFFAVHLWPEPIAGAAALWVIVRKHPQEAMAAAAVGAVVGALPLLHFRYAFLSAPLFLVAAWPLSRRPALLLILAGAAALPIAAATLSYVVSCDHTTWEIWATIDHRAAPGSRLGAFTASRLLDPALLIERIVWPPAGVLCLVPVLALGWRRVAWTWAWPALPMVIAILAFDYSSGPLARFWSPLLPLLAAALYPVRGRSWLPGLLLGFGAAVGLVTGLNPWLCSDAMTFDRLVVRFSELIGP